MAGWALKPGADLHNITAAKGWNKFRATNNKKPYTQVSNRHPILIVLT